MKQPNISAPANTPQATAATAPATVFVSTPAGDKPDGGGHTATLPKGISNYFQRLCAGRSRYAVGLLLATSTAAMATMPSSLRALSDSYQALRTGMSVNTAVELMGNPKTRSDSTWLGIQYADLTWVDIAQIRYQAKFVGDALLHKSATSSAE